MDSCPNYEARFTKPDSAISYGYSTEPLTKCRHNQTIFKGSNVSGISWYRCIECRVDIQENVHLAREHKYAGLDDRPTGRTTMNDVTRYLLSEPASFYSTRAYAFTGKAVRTAKTDTQKAMLHLMNGATMPFLSKALQYAPIFRGLSKRQHKAIIGLIKGGALRVDKMAKARDRDEAYYVISSRQPLG